MVNKEATRSLIGSDGDEQPQPGLADPQSFPYFFVLYAMAVFMYLPLLAAQYIGKGCFNHFFLMFTLSSVSITVLASCILIFASFYLRTPRIKNIHYTLLKSIGCFFAMLAPFSLGVSVYLAHEPLTWIALFLICLIYAAILVSYSFLWEYVCAYQPNNQLLDHDPVHWSVYLLAVPLSLVLYPNLPPWAQTPFRYACLFVLGLLLMASCLRLITPWIDELVRNLELEE